MAGRPTASIYSTADNRGYRLSLHTKCRGLHSGRRGRNSTNERIVMAVRVLDVAVGDSGDDTVDGCGE